MCHVRSSWSFCTDNCIIIVCPLCLLFKGLIPLKPEPSKIFFGKRVTVMCGPPPEALNFSTNWIAEWRRDGTVILADSEHSISKMSGASILTVSRFFSTDNGKKQIQYGAIKKWFSESMQSHCLNIKIQTPSLVFFKTHLKVDVTKTNTFHLKSPLVILFPVRNNIK